jgi:hypothetical protein
MKIVMNIETPIIPEKQIEILKLLQKGPLRQNELRLKVGITGPALLYHLDRMERSNLIIKKMIYQVGNAKNNEISLNPAAMQNIRNILGLKLEKMTLITGYGLEKTAVTLPDNSLLLLKKNHYKINRIVCFTTSDAKSARDEVINERGLITPDRTVIFQYTDYKFLESAFYQQLESILSEELQTSNVILDLTPLTKMLSFKFLELANKYLLPCFYIGTNAKDEYILYWFTNMRIEGSIST